MFISVDMSSPGLVKTKYDSLTAAFNPTGKTKVKSKTETNEINVNAENFFILPPSNIVTRF